MTLSAILSILILIFIIVTLRSSIRIVPQSMIFVVERFGRYTRSLNPGLSIIVPYIDKVAHKVSILERQLPEFQISVITKDNVEVKLETTVFFRIVDPGRTVYRIQDVNEAVNTTASSIVKICCRKIGT